MPAARLLPLLFAGLALAPAAMAAQAATTPATPAVPAAQTAADAPVHAAVAEFVNALNALNAERLGRTLRRGHHRLLSGPAFPRRPDEGRANVQGAFAQLFAQLRQRGTRNVNLQPRAQDVQLYGDVAIATFHLARSAAGNRAADPGAAPHGRALADRPYARLGRADAAATGGGHARAGRPAGTRADVNPAAPLRLG